MVLAPAGLCHCHWCLGEGRDTAQPWLIHDPCPIRGHAPGVPTAPPRPPGRAEGDKWLLLLEINIRETPRDLLVLLQTHTEQEKGINVIIEE